jgi:hypothetical protein
MKNLRDVLTSRGFKREVSVFLFVFGVFNLVISLVLFSSGSNEIEVTVEAMASLVAGLLYVVLGISVRRGSNIALAIVGVLFAIDTILILFEPGGKGLGVKIVSRSILIFVLVRYIRRARLEPAPQAATGNSQEDTELTGSKSNETT